MKYCCIAFVTTLYYFIRNFVRYFDFLTVEIFNEFEKKKNLLYILEKALFFKKIFLMLEKIFGVYLN